MRNTKTEHLNVRVTIGDAEVDARSLAAFLEPLAAGNDEPQTMRVTIGDAEVDVRALAEFLDLAPHELVTVLGPTDEGTRTVVVRPGHSVKQETSARPGASRISFELLGAVLFCARRAAQNEARVMAD